MCGIVGYVGKRHALPVLVEGLRCLEYRGYDSAGVAVPADGKLQVVKRAGPMTALDAALVGFPFTEATSGIGHTRWATHGRPNDVNAHPHTTEDASIAVVHNGIIENDRALRAELAARGHTFRSETDTEVLPHLIEEYYQNGQTDLAVAVRKAIARLRGAYAFVVLAQREPDRIVAVRQTSPLVIGLGEGEQFLASDIPALLPYTRRVLVVEDGQMADLTPQRVVVTDLAGRPVETQPLTVDWAPEQAEKGGSPHFMLKEIEEQPRVFRDTVAGRIDDDGRIQLSRETGLEADALAKIDKIFCVACGTAYHAGLIGKLLIERWAGVPVECDVASEFRYREPLLDARTLVIVISQSGETADTLAALREARGRGAKVLAVVNVMGSSIAREADHVLYTRAGVEIAVASTKAYTSQVLALALFALELASARGSLEAQDRVVIAAELRGLGDKAAATLRLNDRIRVVAARLAQHDDVFFIGRGLDYALAMEGQLKLKEISYIHAEAYAAGELKHGTLALITEDVPVIALLTQPPLIDKAVSNIKEVKARGAYVVGIGLSGDGKVVGSVDGDPAATSNWAPTDSALEGVADVVLAIPPTHPFLAPALAAIPLQLLAYHAAVARGAEVDKPRNLAKSVTVE